MRFSFLPTVITAAVLSFSSMALQAQNVAIVNGKAVPKTRLNMLAAQVERSGRSVTPDMEQQLREEVIMREIFMQEAEKQGLEASDDYKVQLEIAKQSILIRELFAQYQKANPVSETDIKAEYDKFVASNSGKEYRARHILVEKEEQAKAIIASLKKGGKFDEIAKKQSKDPGSGAKGGDLAHRIAPIFVLDVVDHPVPVELAKVDIEVGHGHPVRIQKPLKQQFVLQRVQIGDVERISH